MVLGILNTSITERELGKGFQAWLHLNVGGGW